MPLLAVTTELPSLLALPSATQHQHIIAKMSMQRCLILQTEEVLKEASRLVYGCKQIPTWSLHCKIRYNSCISARRVYSHKSQITARVCWRQIYSNFQMPILLLRNHCSILLPDPFLTKTPMDAKASKRHAHLVKLVDDMIISHNYSAFFEVISYLWIDVGTIFVSKTTYPHV